MIRRLALFACLALAACATPAERIATRLQEAGVPPRQARCMGDKLQDRLSLGQLRRLDSLAGLNGGRLDRMSIAQIARALDDPRDPAIVAEVIRASVRCVF